MTNDQFQNALMNLQDCIKAINDENSNSDEPLSELESKAKQKLIELCCDIALDFGDTVGRDIYEEPTVLDTINPQFQKSWN